MRLDVVFAAFEDEDIVWIPQVLVINNRDTEKGYIVCQWCKIVCMLRKDKIAQWEW